jgi:hypothetical protein
MSGQVRWINSMIEEYKIARIKKDKNFDGKFFFGEKHGDLLPSINEKFNMDKHLSKGMMEGHVPRLPIAEKTGIRTEKDFPLGLDYLVCLPWEWQGLLQDIFKPFCQCVNKLVGIKYFFSRRVADSRKIPCHITLLNGFDNGFFQFL